MKDSQIKIAIFGAAGRMGHALIESLNNNHEINRFIRSDSGSLMVLYKYKLVAAVENFDFDDPMSIIYNKDCGFDNVKYSCDSEAAAMAADVLIDFTFHTSVPEIARLAAKYKKAYVLGTTGLTDEELSAVKEAATVAPVLMAPNFSVGVNLLLELVRQAAAVLNQGYDCEIVEMHHKHKKDAPSGTALALAKAAAAGRGVDLATVACYGREGITGERKPDEIAIHALRGGDVVGDHTVMFAADGERVELTHKATSRACLANGALRAAAWIVGQTPGFKTMKDVLGL